MGWNDVLAKSRVSAREDDLMGYASEGFDRLARRIQFMASAQVGFSSINGLKVELLSNFSEIERLYIHGHGIKYPNSVMVEMGNDKLHNSTVDSHSPALRGIAASLAPHGQVIFLQCFLGSDIPLMKSLVKYLGVPVSGEVALNPLMRNTAGGAKWIYSTLAGRNLKIAEQVRKVHPDGRMETLADFP